MLGVVVEPEFPEEEPELPEDDPELPDDVEDVDDVTVTLQVATLFVTLSFKVAVIVVVPALRPVIVPF